MIKNDEILFPIPQPPCNKKQGFTLLELSIAIAIIALIVGMGFTSIRTITDSAEITATREKLKVIDSALEAYWAVNNRLPCPADATLPVTDANYGIEAANNNAGCFGGTPAATDTITFGSHAAEGMLPFATLNLPESYSLDGWSSRVTYLVDTTTTKTNAALRLHKNSQCPDVKVTGQRDTFNYTNYTTDWNNTATTPYAYSLLSHGKNRFGAYSQTGTRITNDQATEEEGVNAWLNIAPPHATRSGVRYGYISGAGQFGGFDDMLLSKTLWQLNKGREPNLLQDVPVLFASTSDSSDYVYAYKWDGAQFIQHTDIGSAPSAELPGGILTPDHRCQKAISFGNNSTATNNIGYRFETPFLDQLSSYDSSFGILSDANGVAFNPNKIWGAFTQDSSPYFTIIRFWTSTSSVTCLATSCPTPLTALAGPGRGADVSINGHLAMAHETSPFISIYHNPTDGNDIPTTQIADPVSLPTGNATDAAYSLDGTMLAVTHETAPFITLYEVRGTTYSKMSDPDVLPTGTANSVAFSHDGQYLAVGHDVAPYITIYGVDTPAGAFVRLNNPPTLPSAKVNSVDFANAEHVLAVGVEAGSPPLRIYQIQHGTEITDITDPDVLPADGETVHSVKFIQDISRDPTPGIISNGLVGRWRFDDDDDATDPLITADSSSERNDGALVGSTIYSTEVPAALTGSGHSKDFDGINDIVRITDPPGGELDFGTDQDFSISLWVKTTNTGGWILSKYNSGLSPGYGIEIINNRARPFLHDDSLVFYPVQGLTDINDNQWHHIVATYDRDGEFILYVDNGEDAARGNISSANNIDNSHDLVLGGFGATGLLLGQLDDVRIYNRTLTPSEVARIYNGDG